MAVNIPHGKSDKTLEKIKAVLENYQRQHPQAEIHAYRQNPVSIRVKIIDRDFEGQDKSERHRRVWESFDELAEDVQSDISMLLLITPAEAKKSFANLEFEHPVPSRL